MKAMTREQCLSLDKAKFKKTGEICLSITLANFGMGEICPNTTYGYFVI